MPPAREFVVKIILNADEYLAFKARAEEFGMSQSARGRWLMKLDIAEGAHELEMAQSELFDKATGQVLARKAKR